jgi:hypothetical protein
MFFSLGLHRLALFAAVLCLALSHAGAPSARGDINLPPISWTCPMVGVLMPDGMTHADVLEAEKGTCPICKMNLVAVRLDSVWTCPVHAVIAEQRAGKCPIDHRDLVQVTMAVSWICAGRAEIEQLTPGTCPDGSAMRVKYTARPHGNHNPQHGGQFFMAPDNWHHVEGAFPQARVVRLYLYDDYSKPLALGQIKLAAGRIVTKEVVDGATHVTKEIGVFPLMLTRGGTYLEARVDSRTAPAQMAAKVKLKADGPEYRFDFAFPSFTKEPLAPASSTSQASPARAGGTPVAASAGAVQPAAPAQVAGASAPTPGPGAASTPSALPPWMDPTLQPWWTKTDAMSIPATVDEIVVQLRLRKQQLREVIDSGDFAAVYIPAFQAKDLAVAMEAHSAQLPTYKRKILEPAIKRLLRAAWLLDAFGDLGNREQITGAYVDFAAAVSDIESLFQTER